MLTGEHGVGVEKRDLMDAMFNEIDLNQQQRLKCAFDRTSLLNPGKVFPQLCRCAELGRMHVHAGKLALPRSAPLLRAQMTVLQPADESSSPKSSPGRRRRASRWKSSRAAASARSAARCRPSMSSTCRDRGLVDYEPAELILTAKPARRWPRSRPRSRRSRQMLAFEPPDWRGLLGSNAEPTLGGVLAGNLAGPRRVRAGAARDFFLGFSAVNGVGEIWKAGGKVVKNVTGYDM